MKKKLFVICALACGLAFSSCGKKDAANALSDSAKEITEEITQEITQEATQTAAEFNKAEAIQLTEDMDSTSIAEGTSMTGFRCSVCSCPSYCGVYQGYYPSCYSCGHAYGMHK